MADASARMIEVAVVYALPHEQRVWRGLMPQGATVQAALRASGLLDQYPTVEKLIRAKGNVGIFGKPVKLDAQLKAHDRVEVYRPLAVDPKEARRRRAGLRGAKSNAKSSAVPPAVR